MTRKQLRASPVPKSNQGSMPLKAMNKCAADKRRKGTMRVLKPVCEEG